MKAHCRLSCGLCTPATTNPITTTTGTTTANPNSCRGFILDTTASLPCTFLREVSGLVPCSSATQTDECKHYVEDGPHCPKFTTWAPTSTALRYTRADGTTHTNPLTCDGTEVTFGTYVPGTMAMYGSIRSFTVCDGLS